LGMKRKDESASANEDVESDGFDEQMKKATEGAFK